MSTKKLKSKSSKNKEKQEIDTFTSTEKNDLFNEQIKVILQ